MLIVLFVILLIAAALRIRWRVSNHRQQTTVAQSRESMPKNPQYNYKAKQRTTWLANVYSSAHMAVGRMFTTRSNPHRAMIIDPLTGQWWSAAKYKARFPEGRAGVTGRAVRSMRRARVA